MRPIIGIGLKVAATLLFTVMGGMVKSLSDSMPVGEIVFSRNLFALIPLMAMLAWQSKLRDGLKTARPSGHIFRSILGCTAMFLVFASLRRLTLADATAIGFAAPIFTVVFAALILKEPVRIFRWSAVGVGFIGVIIMLWPHLSFGEGGVDDTSQKLGALFALLGAVVAALAVIQVRRLTETETTASIVFYFSTVASLIALATLPWGWVVPDFDQTSRLVGIGIIGGLAQICQTQSYRHAPASVIAPFDYLTMLWSVTIGYFFFNEAPTLTVIAGAAVVIAAGLFVILREARIGLDRSRQRRAKTPFGG